MEESRNFGFETRQVHAGQRADPNTGAAVYDTTRYQGRTGWFVVGGTSLASPLVAAVYALAGNAGSVTYGSYPYAHAGPLYDVVSGSNGVPVGVVNVLGSLFLDPARSMWEIVDDLVEEARRKTPVVVVDVHAEATSEKVALAFWLDGRATAVLGTHTHVQTSDTRILPGGTAALTDVGMTGPHDSVIGVEPRLAIQRMRTGMPVRFETAQGGVRIEGALVECGEDGLATRCEAVRVEVPAA